MRLLTLPVRLPLRGAIPLLLATALTARPAAGQQLEPRAFAAVPVGVNFALLAYGYNTGELLFGQDLPIEDATADLNSVTGFYVRSFGLFGVSAKLGVVVPFFSGTYRGRVSGVDTSTSRTGFADPKLLLAVNFLGAPALTLQEFAGYREGTVLGASLMLSVPVGQYDPSKLVNLGTNRWAARPRLGVSHRAGPWIFEAFGDVWLFSDNPDQFGLVVAQDPIWAVQGHVIRTLKPGLWLGVDAGYGWGGNTTVGGVVKNNQQKNTLVAGTLALPLGRRSSLKLVYSAGVSARVGAEFDTVQLFYQYRWGGGL